MTDWTLFDSIVRKHYVRISHQDPKFCDVYPAGHKEEVRKVNPKLFDEITAQLRKEGKL